MHYQKARDYVLSRLQQHLPRNLYYHSLHHTLDVCRAAGEIACSEGIEGENLLLLLTAALYHDTGFIEQYRENEPIACQIASQTLPLFGYTPEQINIVNGMIMATRVPQRPQTHLEFILCDADLDYLGRDDFFDIARTLQKEWEEYGLVSSSEEWNRKQIAFLEQHHYFTDTARSKRNLQKQKHLANLKALVS